MKVQYKFTIKGNLKPDHVFPIQVNNQEISFILQEGKITGILITESASENNLPKLNKAPGAVFNLDMSGVKVDHLITSLRLAEGLLSVYGLEEIDFENIDIAWIPESNREKEKLSIGSFSYRIEPPSPQHTLTFDLIARPIIAGLMNNSHEAPLSFFRQGKNNMRNGHYIEAVYNFYFVLETMYGNGKTKNAAIEKEFLSSLQLKKWIEEAKTDKGFPADLKPNHMKLFREKFVKQSAENIIKQIIRTRGFLHHHSKKNPRIWSPDSTKEYHLDAIFLMYIASKSVWEIFHKYVYNHEVMKLYSYHYQKHMQNSDSNAVIKPVHENDNNGKLT
ncbi:MAG: hypothetical protein ACYS80_19645 [Planctomycetota bacterium]|jgi:hypothetical protein